MSEENKALARKFLRMFELGDPSMADEIVSTDYYNHDAPDPSIGSDGVKAFVTSFKNAMSDAQVDLSTKSPRGTKLSAAIRGVAHIKVSFMVYPPLASG